MERKQEIEEEELRQLREQKETPEKGWIPRPEDLQWMYEKPKEPAKVTPEQQEAHKGREDKLVETEPGGPHRPASTIEPLATIGLSDGSSSPAESPKHIELGQPVAQEMDTLWQKSVQDMDKGVLKEHAATLVKGQEGELKLVNPVEGTENSVIPNLDIAEGEEFLGTFHTHPNETAFSDQDIASALENQEKISLVRSGDETYALVRTDKTVKEVDADEVKDAFHQEVNKYMEARNVSRPEAIYIANLEMCRRYGLAFYHGKGGSLREVYSPWA